MVENKKESFMLFFEQYPTWQISQLKHFSKPSVVNGIVNVNKYRVTIETIKETDKEQLFRLKYMYLDETNMHNKHAIDEYCKRKFGIRMYNYVEEEKKRLNK